MTRFRDPAIGLCALAREGVAVACPRCRDRALATSTRLSCLACGHSEAYTGRCTWWGVPVDPWFKQPLWLQASCRGHTLWAFNEVHLDLLEGYVGARLRERYLGPCGEPMLPRLPRWMKAAGNRDRVMTTIGRLRTQTTNTNDPGRSRGRSVIVG